MTAGSGRESGSADCRHSCHGGHYLGGHQFRGEGLDHGESPGFVVDDAGRRGGRERRKGSIQPSAFPRGSRCPGRGEKVSEGARACRGTLEDLLEGSGSAYSSTSHLNPSSARAEDVVTSSALALEGLRCDVDE